jgi:hypothetical protein
MIMMGHSLNDKFTCFRYCENYYVSVKVCKFVTSWLWVLCYPFILCIFIFLIICKTCSACYTRFNNSKLAPTRSDFLYSSMISTAEVPIRTDAFI